MRARIVELERIMARRNQNKLGPDLLNDRILEGLNKDLTDTQIQLSALKTRYKDKHPKMVNLANRADILEDEFEGKLNKSYNSLSFRGFYAEIQRRGASIRRKKI